MPLKNNWVGYLERGYLQIKQSILNRVRVKVPEITDFSESNIFVIITSIMAGLVEQLHYYIDQLMRESFIVTARRYTSVVRHARMFDYRIKASFPSSTVLTLDFIKNGEPYTLQSGESETLLQGHTFTTSSGLSFRSTNNVTATVGQYNINIPVSQFELKQDEFTINSSDPDQAYPIGLKYVHGSMSLVISGTPWIEVNSFARSLSSDNHFIIDISEDGMAYLIFGDGNRGNIPPNGGNAIMDYQITEAVRGNVNPGSIINMGNKNWDYVDSVNINQYNNSTGGVGYEDINSIKRNVPLSLRTLDRAVTRKDYEDVALLHPGVNMAYVDFECGKFVDLYVYPYGGGLAQQGLLGSVKDWFEDYRMVTTFVNPRPAGESMIVLNLEVTGRFKMKSQVIEDKVRSALMDNYGLGKSRINRAIRKSDVYALVDNQPPVDFLIIHEMYIIPYSFPLNHNNPLNLSLKPLDYGSSAKFRVTYMGSGSFQLQEGLVPIATLILNEELEVSGFKIKIKPGSYTNGDQWEFTYYPSGSDIVLNDNSIPILTDDNLTLTINEVITE